MSALSSFETTPLGHLIFYASILLQIYEFLEYATVLSGAKCNTHVIHLELYRTKCFTLKTCYGPYRRMSKVFDHTGGLVDLELTLH